MFVPDLTSWRSGFGGEGGVCVHGDHHPVAENKYTEQVNCHNWRESHALRDHPRAYPSRSWFSQPIYAMRIGLGELRALVCEALYASAQDELYQKLRDLAYKQGGLRVTHESPRANFDSIWSEGLRLLDHGIYFTVGWHSRPQWVTSGDGIIVQARIPFKYVKEEFIQPDDRFGSGDDGCRALLEEFPSVTGADIGANLDLVPVGWIDNILDAQGKSLVGRGA